MDIESAHSADQKQTATHDTGPLQNEHESANSSQENDSEALDEDRGSATRRRGRSYPTGTSGREHKEPSNEQPATQRTDTHAETVVLEVGTRVLLLVDERDTDSGAKAWLDDGSELLFPACEVLVLAMALALALSVVVALALKVLAVDDDDGASESLVQSFFETVGGALMDVDGTAELGMAALVLGAGGWVVPGCVEAGGLEVVL